MKHWMKMLRHTLEQEGVMKARMEKRKAGHICITAPTLKGKVFVASTPREKTRTLCNVRRDIRVAKREGGCHV